MDRPVRVLHVDDEPGFADLVAEFLQREDDDITVLTETTARDALDRLATEDVDCVVSDYDMPELNGIELLEAVREDDPDLPFVLFTGKGSEEVASDALSAGATDYLQKGGGTDQYEILANRVRNAVEQHRSKHRAASLERLRNLATDANRELVRASSRADVEQRVVDAISSAEPYRFAWIGTVDEDADRIRPRVAANDDGYLDDVEVTITGEQGTQGPAGRAVESGRVAVSQDVETDPAFDPWREQVRERGVRSAAAVPLGYEDDRYGVLVVYATEPGVFDDAEQQLLAELAVDVGQAIHAHEVRADLALHNRAMNEAPVGISITDPERDDNPAVYVNDAFTEITGYERAEMLGENHRILQGPDTDPEAVAEMRAAIEAREPTSVELRNYRPDGSQFWNRVSIAPIRGDDGDVDHFVGFQEDVTDRKRREQELQESRHRFEALFDDPNMLVGLLDTDGTLRDANDTAMAYVSVDREDVVGEPFWETPWWSSAAVDDLKAWVARAADGEYVEYETDHEQSGNGSLVVEGAIRPVTDDSGEVQSLVVSARDVTDRVQRERLLDAIVENTTAPMFLKDRDGEYVLANDAFCDLFGLTDVEVRGRTDDDLFPASMAAEVRKNDEAVLDTGEPVETEERIVVDGEERVYLSSKVPVYDIGTQVATDEPVAVFGIANDVTERKQRERILERQNERFDELASAVSHDLQTPLSTALGRAQLALETGDDVHLEKAISALERADDLRSDLVETLRARELVRDREPVSVGDASRDVWETITSADTASLTVLDDPTVSGDEGAVRRLLENLLSNAVEHGSTSARSHARGDAVEHAGGDVAIRVGELDDGAGFYVEDDGPGIPPEHRDEVFTAGFSTKSDGSGIGMASVREIVLAHDWSIEITDGEAGGARFEIRTDSE